MFFLFLFWRLTLWTRQPLRNIYKSSGSFLKKLISCPVTYEFYDTIIPLCLFESSSNQLFASCFHPEPKHSIAKRKHNCILTKHTNILYTKMVKKIRLYFHGSFACKVASYFWHTIGLSNDSVKNVMASFKHFLLLKSMFQSTCYRYLRNSWWCNG